MSRLVGTVSRGIRAPIIREGDDIAKIVTESVLAASADEEWGFRIRNRDVIAMTEAIVARAQGNYATVDDIAADVKAKLGGEMGNHLVSLDEVEKAGIDPFKDVLSLEKYRELFGYKVHRFTGVDYVDYYEKLIHESGAECEIIFANSPAAILNYTDHVLCCDIHTCPHTKKILKNAGAAVVLGLDEILNAPVNGSGYNEDFGLLGTNKATEDKVKLFPRDSQHIVDQIQKNILEATGKQVEVMVYGDGAFKDPVGEIWEFADPVVAPFYTAGLEGTPNELKIKYLADNDFSGLEGEALKEAIKGEIEKKDANLVGKMASEGTTPRRLTDLIGSLCDLTSGSGDKGTPIVYIQGYFDNYTTE